MPRHHIWFLHLSFLDPLTKANHLHLALTIIAPHVSITAVSGCQFQALDRAATFQGRGSYVIRP
jgi:hypothetical protein